MQYNQGQIMCKKREIESSSHEVCATIPSRDDEREIDLKHGSLSLKGRLVLRTNC